MGDLDLTTAIAAAQHAVRANNVGGMGLSEHVETAVRAAAEVIAGQVRQATADTIARAIETQAQGTRHAGRAERWHALRDAAAIARRAGDGDGTATT